MKKKSRPKSLIPTGVPVAVLVLMVAGFWIVRPRDIAVAEQKVNLGEATEALKKLERLREKSPPPLDPNIPRVEVRLAREQFEKLTDAEQRRFWVAMFERRLAGEHGREFVPLLAAMARGMRNPAGFSVEYRRQLAAPDHREIAEALVTRELGEGRPALAGELLAAVYDGNDDIDTAARIRLAKIRLQAGDPAGALRTLDDIPPHAETEESTAMRISLLRATGDNRNAAVQIAAYLDTRGERATYEELAHLIAVAREGAEFEAPLRTLARFVDTRPYDTRLRHGYSELLADARRPGEAARQLAYALGPEPEDVVKIRRLVMLKEWSGDLAGAQSARVTLATLGEPEMLEALHDAKMAPDDLNALDVLLKKLLAPGREDELVIAAEFYAWMGRYDDASRLYRRHLAHRPDDLATRRALAIMYEELGHVEQALAVAADLTQRAPKDFELRDLHARLLLANGRRQEALEQLTAAGKLGAGEEILEKEIALARSLGLHAAAAAATERLLAHKKDSVRAYDLMRHALFARETGDYEGAEISLRKVLHNEPANDDARRDLALTLAGRGNYPDALDALSPHTALRDNPDLAALYMDLMRLNDAKERERDYVTPEPPAIIAESRPLRQRLAVLYAGIGRSREALALFAELHREKPGDLDILEPYLLTLIAVNRRNEALELARIHILPTDAKSLRVKGRVYAEANRFTEARDALRQLVKLPGENTEPNLSMLGDVELAAGNITRARQAYAAALRRILGQKNAEPTVAAR